MAKAKHTLTIEVDLDFDLIGLCCYFKDYRIAWEINQALHLFLQKSDEPYIVSGKKGEIISSHSMYEYIDEIDNIAYFFIKNKDNGKLLIPEMEKIDYFFVIKEAGAVDIEKLRKKLKEIKAIILAVKIEVEDLKNAHRFIF